MKFIGRKREMEKLESEYSRDSSFVVIYGRRRVGKTTLTVSYTHLINIMQQIRFLTEFQKMTGQQESN